MSMLIYTTVLLLMSILKYIDIKQKELLNKIFINSYTKTNREWFILLILSCL